MKKEQEQKKKKGFIPWTEKAMVSTQSRQEKKSREQKHCIFLQLRVGKMLVLSFPESVFKLM